MLLADVPPTVFFDSVTAQEMSDPSSDFVSFADSDVFCTGYEAINHGLVVNWFGVKEFCVVSPMAKSDIITSETLRNLVLSAVNLALTNSKW